MYHFIIETENGLFEYYKEKVKIRISQNLIKNELSISILIIHFYFDFHFHLESNPFEDIYKTKFYFCKLYHFIIGTENG